MCTPPGPTPKMVLAASLFSLLLVVAAKPMGRRTMAVHRSRAEPASGFVRSGAAPAQKALTLRIALRQNNIAGLETELYKVSDPASAFYGQYLTADEVAEFVKPTDETLNAVNQWLAENNIASKPVTPAGDMLEISIPVTQANDLLSAEFSVFTHVASGATSIRTLQYSVPTILQSHIDFVHPTISFSSPLSSVPKFTAIRSPKPTDTAPVTDAVPASCGSIITPTCLQAFYGIPTAPATQASNKLGVAGFIDQWANLLDLKQFLTNFRKDVSPNTTFTVETLDGGINSQTRSQAGIEANLDTQYTIGIATNVSTIFISAGENGPDGLDGFLDMITLLISDPARPSVLTTSYAFQDENDLGIDIASTLCNTYLQLSALGTSLLFSSGDGGVSGGQAAGCTNFVTPFPSGCPFITSVGSVGGLAEVGSSFSSGGFSNLFATPDYQTADVAAYVASLGTTYAGLYNGSGRGFPDVAAQGENFEIVWQTQTGTVDGTSCSSPTFAAIIALLNDELVAAGKPTLGFLNPFLYSDAGRAALNDATSGTNPGCGTNGFSASAGWDPITGLGTPNYTLLRTAVGL
ncbi:family S53 protease [Mycena leptocephala]|nr:family S53 protease [Mycena leptocephala]